MSPTRFHESLTTSLKEGVERAVSEAIKRHVNYRTGTADDPARILAQVCVTGSAAVEFGARGADSVLPSQGQLSPDASWTHVLSKIPPFVLEVAWGQDPEELADKAEDFILNSQGRLRTVLAVAADYSKDLESPDAPGARVSLFRYVLENGRYSTDAICDAVPVADASVYLRLADFLPYSQQLKNPTLRKVDSDVGPIELQSQFLVSAVQRAWDVHRGAQSEEPLPPEMASAEPKKRKREKQDVMETGGSIPSMSTSFESKGDPEYRPPPSMRAAIKKAKTEASADEECG